MNSWYRASSQLPWVGVQKIKIAVNLRQNGQGGSAARYNGLRVAELVREHFLFIREVIGDRPGAI
jgi:hypothetical protein